MSRSRREFKEYFKLTRTSVSTFRSVLRRLETSGRSEDVYDDAEGRRLSRRSENILVDGTPGVQAKEVGSGSSVHNNTVLAGSQSHFLIATLSAPLSVNPRLRPSSSFIHLVTLTHTYTLIVSFRSSHFFSTKRTIIKVFSNKAVRPPPPPHTHTHMHLFESLSILFNTISLDF